MSSSSAVAESSGCSGAGCGAGNNNNGQQQDGEDNDDIYLMCKNDIVGGAYCSHIYKKNVYENDTCPVCGTYAAIDIYKEQKLDTTLNENKLHKLFFVRVPEIFETLNLSVWGSLESSAWRTASIDEQIYLLFCMAFADVSGEETKSESDYWDVALATERNIRAYLIDNEIQIVKQLDFDLDGIADGLNTRRKIRTLQANFGISLCGPSFQDCTRSECERKYQKAIKITERLATLGCSTQDNLPYFNAADYMAAE